MTVVLKQYTLQFVLNELDIKFGWHIIATVVLILNLTVHHHSLDTVITLVRVRIFTILTVHFIIIFLLFGMQTRSIVKYLVSQTIIVITCIDII